MTAKHAFNINDGTGVRLASITLYNYGYVTAQQEAQKVAELLTGGDWIISRPEMEFNNITSTNKEEV